jgi:hypothetical protein
LFLPGGELKRPKTFKMGCDCGKIDKSAEALNSKKNCEQSAMLEAPDQRKATGDLRIVGGCRAPHTPWFVYLHIMYGVNGLKCGGVLINKVREG